MSDKMDKTVVVSVERRTQHRLYRKYMTRSKKYAAHDETNRCKVGDYVEIISSRPFSKSKHWAVTRVLKQTEQTPDVEMPEEEQVQ